MDARRIEIYDTTLRDGSQGEGISFSAQDKVLIAKKIDEIGFDYIEGGWPGANPKDIAFFEEIRKVKLKRSQIVAFGSTRKAHVKASEDANLRGLVEVKQGACRRPVHQVVGHHAVADGPFEVLALNRDLIGSR